MFPFPLPGEVPRMAITGILCLAQQILQRSLPLPLLSLPLPQGVGAVFCSMQETLSTGALFAPCIKCTRSFGLSISSIALALGAGWTGEQPQCIDWGLPCLCSIVRICQVLLDASALIGRASLTCP